MRNYNTLKFKSRLAIPATLLSGLGLAACGSHQEKLADDQTPPQTSTSIAPVEGATFTFNDLNGGSPIIMVYPGPGDSGADRQYNGTYTHGQEADIYCVEPDGRDVSSVTSLGEEARQSNDWYLVNFDPNGEAQFASAVYGDIIGDTVISSCVDVLPGYSD